MSDSSASEPPKHSIDQFLRFVELLGVLRLVDWNSSAISIRRSRLNMRSALKKLLVVTLGAGVLFAETYYPSPEAGDGWRRCRSDDDIRKKAGMDPQRLNLIAQTQAQLYSGPWAIAIVRNGYLVREWFGVPAMPATTFDVWSCTKSATGIAFGMLFEDSRNHKLPHKQEIDLESTAYNFIPEGKPLSDPRKEKIKLKHLLSMTSGIPGETQGLLGIAVVTGNGEFELALAGC
jgi:CubicO group peptidase (beta-lactamase class C family)